MLIYTNTNTKMGSCLYLSHSSKLLGGLLFHIWVASKIRWIKWHRGFCKWQGTGLPPNSNPILFWLNQAKYRKNISQFSWLKYWLNPICLNILW